VIALLLVLFYFSYLSPASYKGPYMYSYKLLLFLVLVLTAAFWLTTDDAEAGGSGSWPYPGGDWVISTNTHVWDETVTVTGNVQVDPMVSLTLDNVTLEVQGAQIDVHVWSNFTIQDNSSLACTLINLEVSANLEIYNTTANPAFTAWQIGAWAPGTTIHVNGSTLTECYGSFDGATDITFENSIFNGFSLASAGATYDFYNCDVVLVNDCEFRNMSEDTLFMFYLCPDVDILSSDFLSCADIYTQTNSTVGFGANRILWFLTVEVQDALRQPIAGAGVAVFDMDDTLVYSGTTDVDGFAEWIEVVEIEGYNDETPHAIVVSRLGHYEEVALEIRKNQTVTIRISDFRQQVQVAVEMRNNYSTVKKIPFGDLLCFINLPDSDGLDPDYYVFEWDNIVYYPTSYCNVSVYDHFGRLIWYANQTIDYTDERLEVIPYINFVVITIIQYDEDTEERGAWVDEFNLTLEGSDTSLHFSGDEIAVPEVQDGSNNYTLSWGEGDNHTAGSTTVRDVSGTRTYPPSTHAHKSTGFMVADIGVKTTAATVAMKDDFWTTYFGWLIPFIEGNGWLVLGFFLTVISAFFLIKKLREMGRSSQKVEKVSETLEQRIERIEDLVRTTKKNKKKKHRRGMFAKS